MVKRRRQFQKSDTLCFECVHSVPCAERRRGCEWSVLGKPVPGWEAEKTGTSYRIKVCPRYRKG